MRSWLPFSERYRRFYCFSVLFAIVGAAWIAVNLLFEGHAFIVCPSKLLFLIPCPGCGMTRAFFCLVRGDFLSALYFNANVFVVLPLLSAFYLCLAVDLAMSKVLAFRFYQATDRIMKRRMVFAAFAFAEIGIWLHSVCCGI